jgi:phosphoribosylanthranilate isomerase
MTLTKPAALRLDGKTWCKICGITQPQDARLCSELGVDAVGLNFVTGSPRVLALDAAQHVAKAVSVTKVGLFVDAERDFVASAIDACALDVVQFQGNEAPSYCESFNMPYLKAVRVQETTDVQAFSRAYASAMALLLDAYVPGVPGGTGQRFEWELWPDNIGLPLILAGGLTVANVAEAIGQLEPAGVDVSGGVEGPIKGQKDADLIRKFVREVRDVG